MSTRHGWWCGARTYPLTCKYCGSAIFHFSCDCGCSVLFEALGSPWPVHRCLDQSDLGEMRLVPAAQDVREILSGTIASTLSDEDWHKLSRQIDASIDSDYVRSVQSAAKRMTRRPDRSATTVRQDPYHDCHTTERGIVRELVPSADIIRKAGLPEGSLGVSALGSWARDNLAQLTIHTGALATDDSENCSFTFFVREAWLDDAGVAKGSLVMVALRGIVLKSTHPVWVCERLQDI